MNVGIVTTWFERGSAYVSRQYVNLLEKHFNVFVYARGEKYAINDSNWNKPYVTWGKRTSLSAPKAIDKKDFLQWINKNKIDIIFFNEQQWWPPVLWCKDAGVVVGTYVDYYTKYTIPFFSLFDFLICNSLRHMSVFKWHSGSYYIPWGVDCNLFRLQARPENRCMTFFHSAGLNPERKGTDLVIKAFLKVKGDVRLVIHTNASIYNTFPKIRKDCLRLIKQNKLTIINEVVGAPGLYNMGDVYVYPSRLDGLGLTIYEALASGLPIVTTNNPPMNEIVNQTNGRLVKVDKYIKRKDSYFWKQCLSDVNDLQKQMQFYIDNFNRINIYKNKARKYAVTKLNWVDRENRLASIFSHAKRLKDKHYNSVATKTMWFEIKRGDLGMKLYYFFPYIHSILVRIKHKISK